MLSEKEARVVVAAKRLFERYGYRKTTMNDIAREAGMSRQTLYGLHANKEEVLRAAMIDLVDQTVTGIEEGLVTCETLAARLELIFEWVVVKAYQRVKRLPDAKDLVEGRDRGSLDVVRGADARYEQFLGAVLEPHAGRLGALDTTPGDLAQLLLASARGLKSIARDARHLRQLLAGLVRLVTEALDLEARSRDDVANVQRSFR